MASRDDRVSEIRSLVAMEKELKIEKLRREVEYEDLRLQGAKLELAKAVDLEADRLAKPGSREYRQLNIFEPIYGNSVDTWIAALEHWERRDPGMPITIRINSPGGAVLDGFALLDTILRLRRKGHHVTTHGIGMVASMATILMQAGDERILDKNSWFMIHEVGAGTRGKVSDMEDELKFINKLQDRLLDLLAERSTLNKTQIKRRWKKTDDWMSADEALALGFVDRVE
jgi:ATP-dependent Clp endopeptidase proteolytic subunit ClpP